MEPEIKTADDFTAYKQKVKKRDGFVLPYAFGVGMATLSSTGQVLDTWFPFPNFMSNDGTAVVLMDVLNHLSGTVSYMLTDDDVRAILHRFTPFLNDGKRHDNIDAIRDLKATCDAFNAKHGDDMDRVMMVSFVDHPESDPGPQTVSDTYLRLHLLSHRLVKPNCINLEGVFAVLPNVAWTSEGPVAVDEVDRVRMNALARRHPLHVNAMDKFPRMVDYVIPSGVRIADAARVRLGAYLGEGTTVMHEGSVNFNAGTLGASMVEGRISAGVVVGDQTDIGGGASTMGTLSGGGKEKISLGRGCLLGANSGIGISLGDRCVVEAGLYVTAGMPVMYGETVMKAGELSGSDELTFRRNGQTGQVEVLHRPNDVELNDELHAN